MKKVLIGIMLLVIVGYGGLIYLGHASRSGTAPGLADGRLADCPSAPNCVSSEVDTPEDKRVPPLPASVWSGLPGVIAALGGTVTETTPDYLAAEFTSETFGFVDDVEFRLADGTVHIRSGSRVGYSDRGVNAARVADIRAKLGS